jgi:hypothetical protein
MMGQPRLLSLRVEIGAIVTLARNKFAVTSIRRNNWED